MPERATRSTAPLQSSRSGLIGFLISTGTSTPRNASATSCTLKGFTVVLAPIHNTSTSKFNASCTCLPVATSTVVGNPVSFFALCNHGKPFAPIPSNMPGFVLGFQMPARSISTLPVAARRCAVCITCSSVSALHGPLMISGRLAHAFCAASFIVCSIVCIVSIICKVNFYVPNYCNSENLLLRRTLVRSVILISIFRLFYYSPYLIRILNQLLQILIILLFQTTLKLSQLRNMFIQNIQNIFPVLHKDGNAH